MSGSTITTKQAETEQGQDQLKLRLDYTRFSLVEFGVDLVFMFDGMDMVRFFCFSKLCSLHINHQWVDSVLQIWLVNLFQ